MTRETFKYRPSLYSPRDLQNVFVGRESSIKRLLNAIDQAGNQKGIPSYLLVGPRGIGKTHLLLLIHHSVRGEICWQGISDNLHQNWISVLFPEESYGISSLAELLLEVLSTLQNTAYGPEREKIETLLEQCNQALAPGKTERELLIDCLAQVHTRTGKRFLFLIDNLQMVLSRLSNEDQSRLRDLLMQGEWLMLIGAAPTLFEAVTDYEKPFYNLFEIIWLDEITLDQIEALFKERLRLDGHDEFVKNFESIRYRLQAVLHLAGGNPRLVLSLYQIFAEAEILEVERAFLTLLDELTPYFQDRMSELSPQQQKVLDALALMDGPSPPTQLAKTARLKVNTTTTQLGRLEKDGYLKSQKETGQKETLYDIRERMFRLWRQMSVEAGRQRLHVIVKFLEAWFTPDELIAYSDKLISFMYGSLNREPQLTKMLAEELYYFQEAIIYGLEKSGEASMSEQEVQAMLKKARTQKDDHLLAQAWFAKAFLHSERGEFEKELELYDDFIKRFADATEPALLEQVAIALVNKGTVLRELGKLTQALKESEKAYHLALEQQDRELIGLAAQHAFSISLSLSKKNAQRSNLQRALVYFKRALTYCAKISSKIMLTRLGNFLNDLAKTKNAQLLEQCLELISKIELEELKEFIKPYQAALLYHQTHDKKILNRLFPEIREVVEEMVTLLEGKREKPKRHKRKK